MLVKNGQGGITTITLEAQMVPMKVDNDGVIRVSNTRVRFDTVIYAFNQGYTAFDNRIVRGLMRRNPDIDIIRIQDTHLAGADDTEILERVFQQKRILLTHDVSTMTHYAYERINAGQSISGIIEVAQSIQLAKLSMIS